MSAVTQVTTLEAADLESALSEALQSMRDVPGVQGSFVVSDLGRLLARDMPALFGDDILGEAGPRALRLRETLADGGEPVTWCVVRYATSLLCLRPLRDGLLITLTEKTVNLPALRMAMTHTSRRLNPLLDGPPGGRAVRSDPARPEVTVSRTQEMPVHNPTAASATVTAPDPAPVRFYRGAVVKGAR